MPDFRLVALEPVVECPNTEPGKNPVSAPERIDTLSAHPRPTLRPSRPHRLSIFAYQSFRFLALRYDHPFGRPLGKLKSRYQFVIVMGHTPPFKSLLPIMFPAAVAGTICTDAVPTPAPALE